MKFSRLASVFDSIEAKSSRLEMTRELASLFEESKGVEIRKIVYFLQGMVKPAFEGIDLGLAEKSCINTIARVSGRTIKQVEASYRKTGDLGETAAKLIGERKQKALGSFALTVEKVYGNIMRIASASGTGSHTAKARLLGELLSNANPNEAKVITRFVTGRLRLGVGNATIIDALSFAKAEDKSLRNDLERAFNLTSDLGLVAETLYSKGMNAILAFKTKPFNPIRPALGERMSSSKAIIDKLGECMADGKYDGLRVQVHKSKDEVRIYSRRQEDVTHMFPDIVKAVLWQVKANEVIFEGEAIGFDEETNRFQPFQETAKRKRKHGVQKTSKEIPLRVFAFELLYLNGTDYTLELFEARRKKLESIIQGKGLIRLSKIVRVKTAAELEAFFNKCVESGLEGVMAKDLKAPYVAGARKFAWIKLKKSYKEGLADTLDTVVVGYYYGKGKRTKLGLGGLLTAVRAGSEFKTIAKIGTGFSEEQLKDLSVHLGKLKVPKKPREVNSLLEPHEWVKPELVVEVKADELSRSQMHTAARVGSKGLALRFPRLVRIRYDKSPAQASTQEEAEALYALQLK